MITKRITVVNDGFCNRKKSAEKRLTEAVNRYVTKLQKSGWIPCLALSCGNAFAVYEGIVRMEKPSKIISKKELEEFALSNLWVKNEDGMFIWE